MIELRSKEVHPHVNYTKRSSKKAVIFIKIQRSNNCTKNSLYFDTHEIKKQK